LTVAALSLYRPIPSHSKHSLTFGCQTWQIFSRSYCTENASGDSNCSFLVTFICRRS